MILEFKIVGLVTFIEFRLVGFHTRGVNFWIIHYRPNSYLLTLQFTVLGALAREENNLFTLEFGTIGKSTT